MSNTVLDYLLTTISAAAFATSSLLAKYAYQAGMICLVTAVVAGVAPFFFLYRGIALIGANRAAIVSVVELPMALLLGLVIGFCPCSGWAGS